MMIFDTLEEAFRTILGSEKKISIWLSDFSLRLGSKKEDVISVLEQYRGHPKKEKAYIIHRSGFQSGDDYQIEIQQNS